MGLSISPNFWILSVFKNNKERDLKIADYLDQISEEAAGLAMIWENVAKTILATGVADAEGNTVWIRLVERPEWTIYSKNIPRSRLELFYDRIASILADTKQSGELDFVICRIGSILQKRRLTREMIEEELKRLKDARFFDKNNRVKDDVSIQESIGLLNREVEALCSYAKEYRTKIK